MMTTSSPQKKWEQNILSAAKGGGVTFTGSLAAYMIRFILGVFLGRALGPEQYGLYGLTLTAATVAAGLALLGLPVALIRYIALYQSQQDEANTWGVLQIGLGLTTATSLLMATGIVVFAQPIAEQIFHEPRLVPLLRLVSVVVPFLTLTDALVAATRGFNKMQYAAFVQGIVQPGSKLLLIGILMITGMNVTQALLAHIVSIVLGVGMLVYFLNRLFPLLRPLHAAQRDVKSLFKFALPLYITYLINTFRANIQTVLLGALNSVTTVGVFTAASQVNRIGKMFHSSIVAISMPIVSALYGQNNLQQLKRFYQTMTKWTLTLNLPLFLVILLFPESILSIFGNGFTAGTAALAILAWSNLVDAGTGICGVLINMTGKTIFGLFNSIVLLVLTLGLNMWLISSWGVVGAAIATLLATTITNFLRLAQVFIVLRLLPYNLGFGKPVVAGMVSFMVIRGLQFLLPDTMFVFLGLTAFMFVLYVGMILLLGISDDDRLVLNRLLKRVRAMLPAIN